MENQRISVKNKKVISVIALIIFCISGIIFYSNAFESKEVKEGRFLLDQITEMWPKKLSQIFNSSLTEESKKRLKESNEKTIKKHKLRNKCKIKFAKDNFNKTDWKYYLAYLRSQVKFNSEGNDSLNDLKNAIDDMKSFKNQLRNLSIMDENAASFLVKFERMELLCDYE